MFFLIYVCYFQSCILNEFKWKIFICFVVIFLDFFMCEIMKEFYNMDFLFKEYKYVYGELKESKKIYVLQILIDIYIFIESIFFFFQIKLV